MIEYNKELPMPVWFQTVNRLNLQFTLRDFRLGSSVSVDNPKERAWLELYGIVKGGTSDMCFMIPASLMPCIKDHVFSEKRSDARLKKPRENHLVEALKDDSISKFELYRSLGYYKITPALLKCLLREDGAQEIALHALHESGKILHRIPKWSLLTHLCGYCRNEDKCIAISQYLIDKGLDVKAADALGLTALSYTLFARREAYYMRSSDRPVKFEEFLLSRGCNPYRKDILGLSYERIADEFYIK